MVMALGFGDAEADRDDVVPRRIDHVRPVCMEVPEMKARLIAADAQRLGGQQRFVGAAVGIGDRVLDQHPFAEKLDPDPFGRATAGGIQHMRGQITRGPWQVRAVHPVQQPQPGDTADFGQRCRQFLLRVLSGRRSSARTTKAGVWRRTQMMNGKPKRAA
jgi:hypothetical protein